MRKSIDGLCAIVEQQLHMDPRRSALYLVCGKCCDRIKALLWESDGFVLLYKRSGRPVEIVYPVHPECAFYLFGQQKAFDGVYLLFHQKTFLPIYAETFPGPYSLYSLPGVCQETV